MFPISLYPVSLFPTELFPKIGADSGSTRYGDLIYQIVESILATSGTFNINTAMVTLWQEPFPTQGGPLAYVMPGPWQQDASQIDGAGRYFSIFNCQFTVRVIDRSVRDQAYVDTARLTLASVGLLRTADVVINLLDVEIVYESDGITPLVVEPLKLLSQSKPMLYGDKGRGDTLRKSGKSREWSYIDLVYNARITLKFVNYALPDYSVPSVGSIPTNLADVLLAIQSLIVTNGFFTRNECPISLSSEPFPQIGTPFCVITPGEFRTVDGHWSGDGRYFATLEGIVTITIIEQNVLDQGYQDFQRLLNHNSLYGLYITHQDFIEGMHLAFPVNPDGKSVTEEGIRLVSVGIPRYYGESKAWVALDSVFKLRYYPDVTLP